MLTWHVHLFGDIMKMPDYMNFWRATCRFLHLKARIMVRVLLPGNSSFSMRCLDSGAKKVLIPATSMIDFATVPPDLMSAFQLIPYQSAEDAVFKALGVE